MDLQQFRKLARNWDAFGDADPLFGVLSDPAKFGGQWRVDDFFASGDAHVKKWLRILRELGATFYPGTCLDFGCGVGRLTRPLSESFLSTVGIDVAKSMIAVARRYNRNPRCRFVVNRDPDLRSINASTFDFVHSCLVLQHIPPDVTIKYIEEFFRVAKPDGLIVFQLPAERYSEETITERYRLPDDAYAVRIVPIDTPATLRPGEPATVRLTVTNEGPHVLAHDIPAGRHLSIANHWLRADGSVFVADDGRAMLPETLPPGHSVRSAADGPCARRVWRPRARDRSGSGTRVLVRGKRIADGACADRDRRFAVAAGRPGRAAGISRSAGTRHS